MHDTACRGTEEAFKSSLAEVYLRDHVYFFFFSSTNVLNYGFELQL